MSKRTWVFIFLLCSAKCVYFYTWIYLPVVTGGCRSCRHYLAQLSEGVGKRKLLFTYMPLMIHICIEFSSVSPKHCFSYIPQILRYYFHFPAFQNFLIFTETASLTHGYLQFEALFVFGFGRATWLVIEPGPSAVREQSPNHWITRKFPISLS